MIETSTAMMNGIDPEGTPAVSPATFPDLRTTADYRAVAAEVRETAGGIPIGAKLSAQRIEADLEPHAAVEQHAKMEGRQLTMVLAPKKKK